MRAFNKRDMAQYLVEKQKFKNKSQASSAINAVLESIEVGLERTNKVKLVGFGTFSISSTKERKGRNPSTGETLVLPKHNRVCFHVGKPLRAKFKFRGN
ncbi:HU family DNA-binding protein [Ligilactobacillus sp. LYQ135]